MTFSFLFVSFPFVWYVDNSKKNSRPYGIMIFFFFIEILDFGYPQNSEPETLKLYITTEGVKSEKAVVSILIHY